MQLPYVSIPPGERAPDIRARILRSLGIGPVQSFGSRRDVDAQLRKLKSEGLIKFTPKNRGGHGWELCK